MNGVEKRSRVNSFYAPCSPEQLIARIANKMVLAFSKNSFRDVFSGELKSASRNFLKNNKMTQKS